MKLIVWEGSLVIIIPISITIVVEMNNLSKVHLGDYSLSINIYIVI